MKRIVAVFCLFIICLPISVHAMSKVPNGSTVAIVGVGFMGEDTSFDNISRSAMAKVAKEYMGFHLEKQTDFIVELPEDVANTADEQHLFFTGEVDDNTAMNLGKSLQADYILYGNILGVGINESSNSTIGFFNEKIDVKTKLHIKLIDARTGRIVASSMGDGISGASTGASSFFSLVSAFTSVHVPIDSYMWDQTSVNGEIIENSVEEAAAIAVEKMLGKIGIKGRVTH